MRVRGAGTHDLRPPVHRLVLERRLPGVHIGGDFPLHRVRWETRIIEDKASTSNRFLCEVTGLYNRRGFLMLADGHLALAQRHHRAFSLLFADLDYLKSINDQYGHAAGDRALIAAARILRQAYRSADVVARLGGDEFVVFPLEVTADAVPALVARLHQHLEDYNSKGLEPFKVLMSAG